MFNGNPNVTWDIVEANPDKPWDYYFLSGNAMTKDPFFNRIPAQILKGGKRKTQRKRKTTKRRRTNKRKTTKQKRTTKRTRK